jgi:predicted phosphate transport protein (TIGR00153 family)
MTSFRFIPRDQKFFVHFIADGENLLAAAKELEAMLATYDHVDEHVAEIRRLEHRGDEIDRDIDARLEKAFVTPFDRDDIHALVSRLDDIVDGIQEVAETFVIYHVAAPTPEAQRLSQILAAQAEQLLEALRKLEKLKGLEPHLTQIHELENEADGLSRAAIGKLFTDRMDPLEVIKLRDVYLQLEETIDAAEDTGEVIERLLHKAG